MPIPAPNLYPDFNTIRLSHVCLNVKNLADSKTFYTDIVGLQLTDENDSHVYLRAMEERGHHCIILQKSDLPGTVEVMASRRSTKPIWTKPKPTSKARAARHRGWIVPTKGARC